MAAQSLSTSLLESPIVSTTEVFEHEDQGMELDNTPDLINSELVQLLFCILYATVFVLGVFGNVLVCYVVLRNRAMQTVTNMFITNLALSDILLCVLAVPFTPLYTFMGRWAFGKTLCHLVSFAQGCSIYISTLTLTSIAIDRYFVIIYPFHPRMKLSTCIAIIVSIWVISVLATLPYGMYMKVGIDAVDTPAVYNVSASFSAADEASSHQTTRSNPTHAISNVSHTLDSESRNTVNEMYVTTTITPKSTVTATITKTTTTTTKETKTSAHVITTSSRSAVINMNASLEDEVTYCEENWPSEQYRKVFGSVTTILQFVLPFVLISICYTWVSIKLNARARAKPGSKSSRREEADRDRKKRTNRMLISMVAVFGLSWLPLNVVNIFDDFYEKSNEWKYYTLFFFVAHSIAMSSTCYNPFLYAWLNENFRKEFKHVLPFFNPSNHNIINLTRGYNRSNRKNCGSGGANAVTGSIGPGSDACVHDGENSFKQETRLRMSRQMVQIVPCEPICGNDNSSISSTYLSQRTEERQVNILLNDKNWMKSDGHLLVPKCRRDRHNHEPDSADDSADEHTFETFSETPFISSDNATVVTMLKSTSCIESGDDRIRRQRRSN